MLGIRAHKLAAVLAGAALLFMLGCTPGSSSSSSNDPTGVTGIGNSGNDPVGGDPGGDPPAGGDPGSDPPGDGALASVPEPATGLLFLCAAGSMALVRLRARKRA
jgi:hypothetical protein